MAATVKITVELKDFNGALGTFSFHIPALDFIPTDPTFGVATAILDALKVASDCQIVGISANFRAGYTDVVAVQSAYSQIEDKLRLSFTDADGRVGATMSMPGPATTLFLAGTNDVGDKVDAALDALVQALIGQAVTAAGTALTALWKAYRTRTRIRPA